MYANYHTHTTRCRHAWGEDREYIEAAISNGMKVLGFSDHCPWIYDGGYASGVRMLPNQLDDYFSKISALKKEYEKDIKIYIGFESEYLPSLMESQNRLLEGYPVDYMILGQHFLENEENSAYTGFPTDSEAVLERYVNLLIEGMETGKYAYVAHPDLLNFTGSDEIYEKHFTRLCKYLKEKNVPVEINLLGVVEKRHYTSHRFLDIAQRVGNTAIIGCDAHTPDRLCNKEYESMCVSLARQHNLTLIDTVAGLE